MDGSFKVNKKEDGYYIEVKMPDNDGKKVEVGEITKLLQEENIDYDISMLIDVLENSTEDIEIKINDLVETVEVEEETNEKNFNLYVSEDRMRAYVRFYATKNSEFKMDIESILDDIRRFKITATVDEELLNSLQNNVDFNKDYTIAIGKNVVQPKEPEITYHFKTEKDFRPEVDEDGNVNYHKISVVAHVEKGQLLATLTPGIEGIPGYDVYGNVIVPLKQKIIRLKRGKNVIVNDDGTELFADADGLVKLEDGKVVVNDSLDVPGNVGTSTGDLEFKGSVVVNGNVMTGFSIKAKGDIEVLGVVEGAVVEAGGNILLHRGIQGMNRCKVSAGGDVMARYIENGEVFAGGSIHSEAILHSNVSAKGEIKVEGKKGMITGGNVRAGTEITANILGSHMGTSTNIEVGIDPAQWDEYNDLLKEYPKLQADAEKLEQVLALLNKRKEIDGELDEQKKEMYISATRNKIILTNKISQAEKRIEELKVEVERRNDGKIKVRNTIYPGVRITIGTAKYFVRDEIKYVSMYKEGADVKLTSL